MNKRFKEAAHVSIHSIPKSLSPKVSLRSTQKYKQEICFPEMNFQLAKRPQAKIWSIFGLRTKRSSLKSLKGVLNLTKKTQKICLYFTWQSRSPESSQLKMTEALKKCPRLRSITFSFSDCSNISDSNLGFLCGCLKRLKFLKEIVLNFHCCFQITDIGLQLLSKCFKPARFLQKTNLNFSNCSQITDQGLYFLSKSIKRLTCLQSVSLDFSFFSKITDNGLEVLARSLERVLSLRIIVLRFHFCLKITGKGVYRLHETMSRLPCLQKRYISLWIFWEVASLNILRIPSENCLDSRSTKDALDYIVYKTIEECWVRLKICSEFFSWRFLWNCKLSDFLLIVRWELDPRPSAWGILGRRNNHYTTPAGYLSKSFSHSYLQTLSQSSQKLISFFSFIKSKWDYQKNFSSIQRPSGAFSASKPLMKTFRKVF